ncbi:hypothetical protein TNCV_2601001 [Trichonephila clavipes]|nr:hypothetical protein TNCV_2601001 [Trichonephila clavipes]
MAIPAIKLSETTSFPLVDSTKSILWKLRLSHVVTCVLKIKLFIAPSDRLLHGWYSERHGTYFFSSQPCPSVKGIFSPLHTRRAETGNKLTGSKLSREKLALLLVNNSFCIHCPI